MGVGAKGGGGGAEGGRQNAAPNSLPFLLHPKNMMLGIRTPDSKTTTSPSNFFCFSSYSVLSALRSAHLSSLAQQAKLMTDQWE